MNNADRGVWAVSFHDVNLSFKIERKKTTILNNVNLYVAKGTIFGLLGPSGCGKTTLLKCVVARLKPDQGTVKVFDQIPGTVASKIPGLCIGYMPQELALYPELTVDETLNYFGRLHRMNTEHVKLRIKFLVDFLNFPSTQKLIHHLSGGEKRRVSLAIALLHQPPLLILDEPTVGVDPILRESIWKYLIDISTMEGVTVIITTHYIEEAKRVNKVAFMRSGSILAQDEPCAIMLHYKSSSLENAFLKLCESNNSKQSNRLEKVKTTFTAPNGPIRQKKKFDDKQVIECPCDSCLPSLIRIKGLTILNFIRMWRNVVLLIFQLLNPALQIWLFFWSIGSDPKDLRVAVCNQDNYLGLLYLQHISNETIHQVNVRSQEEGEALVQNGNAWAIITIWPNFTDALFQSSHMNSSKLLQPSVVHVRSDNTNQFIFYILEEVLLDAYLKLVNDIPSIVETVQLPSFPVKFEKPIYGSTKPKYSEFLTPGALINMIFFLAVSMTALSFVIDKKEGLLERTFVSGATSVELLFSYLITQLGVIAMQVGIVLVIAIHIFHVENKGSAALIMFLAFCHGLCGMAFGIVISTISNNGATAILLAMGAFMPFYFTSGCFWPIEAMPKFLQYATQFQPMTLPTKGIQWVLSRGKDITFFPVWRGLLVTIVWIIIFLTLATILMRIRR